LTSLPVEPRSYYSDLRVAGEIVEFLRGRWVGVEGSGKRWVRWLGDKPLTIRAYSDLTELFNRFWIISPRSIYGSIEVYAKLEKRSDVVEGYWSNVISATPFIDIDIVDESRVGSVYKYVIEVVEALHQVVCVEHGVCESVYVVWTGAGAHFRFNERGFSREIFSEHHPVKVAYAVAEYTIRSVKTIVEEIIRESGNAVKVENIIAPKRVFTAPLSLHRSLDYVAVAFKPEVAGEFTLDWCDPRKARHDPSAWRRFKQSELDDYAREALKKLGVLAERTVIEYVQKTQHVSEESGSEGEVSKQAVNEPGRFQVMALLQAARYYILTGDLEKAKSWGLNRAIFYAWAKYYGPGKQSVVARKARSYTVRLREVGEDEVEWLEVGGEKAMVSKNGWFVIGGVEQHPEDFDHYVAKKFEEAGIDFKEAWEKALEYVRRFPRGVLLNPREFYEQVYEPVRDNFTSKILKCEHVKQGKTSILNWLKSKTGSTPEDTRH